MEEKETRLKFEEIVGELADIESLDLCMSLRYLRIASRAQLLVCKRKVLLGWWNDRRFYVLLWNAEQPV